LNSEDAGIMALSVLTFLLDDTQRIEGFLRMTGTTPDDLRTLAATNDGQIAFLDYLLGNEPLLLAFTAEQECDDHDPARARQTLAGRPMTAEWTST